ncbi:hypothetical protein [Sphingomonas spermidinifaciens]|uniref:hypothetical protein n=1 Tax=Sphingomonas spermidinifaciens TaxID=1141889 RepID=UPI0015970666|nr:hypothetical protein [Sphingomonas spermidinifaciens]
MTKYPPADRDLPKRLQVSRPLASDRLTNALRGAYGRDLGLPDDMVGLLRELDRKTAHH